MPRSRSRRLRVGLAAAVLLTSTAGPTSVATASTDPEADVVARMTAGTAPVTDAAGHVWAPRSATLGTKALSTRLVGKDVAGTTDDVLYQRNAWGVTGYTVAVPAPGTYRVRLLMAEDTFDAAGRRVFDVAAEGVPAATGIDIAKAVGKGVAYDVTFDTVVADGRLDLAFTKNVDLPLVSAVEVTRVDVPSAEVGPFDLRMSSRTSPLDHGGHTWLPAGGWVGPARRSTALEGQPIGSTDDDDLYRSQTWGMTGWSTPVPGPGVYTVQLFTAEGKFTQVGSRVYDVTAEGHAALTDVDVYRSVGVRTAYAPSFDVQVTDGRLDLGFVNKADFAAIGSIRITRQGDATPVADPTDPTAPPSAPQSEPSPAGVDGPPSVFTSTMIARPTGVVAADGRSWAPWSASLGSWRLSRRLIGRPVTGADDPELYRTNVWGATGYSLPVSSDPAEYRVRVRMAEDSFSEAGRRVFDIRAEGQTVAQDVDIAKAVGIGAAYDVTFTTRVTDGMLSLDFVKKVDQPLVSAIEVISTGPVTPPSSVPHRVFPLSPQSFWTQDVSQAPLDPNSPALVGALAQDVADRAGGIAGFNAYEYGVGYHVARAGDPYVTVDRSCGDGGWTPGVYDGAAAFLDVPVPGDAVPAVGSDRHMAIYDPRTDRLWSFWQMQRSAATGRWSACWGGRIDAVSSSQGVFPEGFGAAASGLAMPPGMVTQDEVRRGRIDHAIAVVIPHARKGIFSWPANRTDGVADTPDAVMQGQRLRLATDVDLDACDLTPLGRMIAEAAKKYGVVPVDTSGAVAVLAQAGDLQQAQSGSNPWWALVGDRQWEVMRNFPWDRLQALPKDYGRPTG